MCVCENGASLTALNLSSITSEDTDAVVEALEGNTALVNLQLNLHFDPPVALIKAVASSTVLRKLNLNGCVRSGDSFAALAEAIESNTVLEELLLNSNRLTRADVGGMARFLSSNTVLRSLSLEGNLGIGTLGTNVLAAAMGCNRCVCV